MNANKLSFDFLKKNTDGVTSVKEAVIESGVSTYEIPYTHPCIPGVYQQLKPIYEKAGMVPRLRAKLEAIRFLMYVTTLELEERAYSEWRIFTEIIDVATCQGWLENTAIAIKELAGLEMDDRDLFLERLRKEFAVKKGSLKPGRCFDGCCHHFPV